MRDSARDALTLEYAICPECGQKRVIAGPFSKSGPLEGRSTRLGVTEPADERGYKVCAGCALVLNDEAAIFGDSYRTGLADAIDPALGLASSGLGSSSYSNHYDRLIRRHTSYDMRRGDLLARLAVPRKTRDRVTFLSGVLYDTDALCSSFDVRGYLKDETIRAVERFFRDVPVAERRRIRYEAFVTAILEAVLKRRAPDRLSRNEGVRLWRTFDITEPTQLRARERVESWFSTYWKGA